MFKEGVAKTLAVAGVGLGVVTLGMIWSIANMALASIQTELYATVHQLQWMMTSFGIFMCGPLLAMGKFGDVFGKKPFYLLGLFIAFFASIIAGFAHEIWVLIVCMGLFGFAGSMILPLSQALLVHQFPESQRDYAVAIWSMFASLSLASGPFIGGVILNYLGWRWIYWINIPLALIAIGMVLFFVENERQKERVASNWSTVCLIAIFTVSWILPIMQGPFWGWKSIPTLIFFLISLISIGMIIWKEKREKAPLFSSALFANRAFLCSAIPNGCGIGFLWVFFFIVPLYLQNVLNFNPFQTGSIFLLVTAPVFFFSKIVGKWAARLSYKLFILAGCTLFSLIFLFQAKMTPLIENLLLSCLFFGMAWVLTWGTSISCALSSVPHKFAGTAAGMFNAIQELFAVTSLSIAGVFFHKSQQNHLAKHLDSLHKALSGRTADEFASLISDPVEAARQLGASSEIIPWLLEAFMRGYHTIFWVLFYTALFAVCIAFFIPKKKTG